MGWNAKGDCRPALLVRPPASRARPFAFRDVRTDAPTFVDLDSAGARSTMTRATDIEQQASEWIIRSEGGDFTDGQRAELERWLLNPRHRITFLRIREAWHHASRIRSTRPLDGNVDPKQQKNTKQTKQTKNKTNSTNKPKRIAVG